MVASTLDRRDRARSDAIHCPSSKRCRNISLCRQKLNNNRVDTRISSNCAKVQDDLTSSEKHDQRKLRVAAVAPARPDRARAEVVIRIERR